MSKQFRSKKVQGYKNTEVNIIAQPEFQEIYLFVEARIYDTALARLSPLKARRVAQALNDAADAVEEKK